MSKAFTKEDTNENQDIEEQELPALTDKNYVTPEGHATLQNELQHLVRIERPKVVEVVSWAAGNGDRSENGDYIYGKKRLREIDRRIRYLTKRIENAEVVDPALQQTLTQVFFGATVTYQQENGEVKIIKIVGVDEADLNENKVSWLSPIARSLLKSSVGDQVEFKTPSGTEVLVVLKIEYLLSRNR